MRRMLRGAALAVLALAMLGGMAGSAQAARVHKLEVNETLPNNETPFAVAVDQVRHHLYVVAFDAIGHRRIYNFDENGELDPTHPELTGTPSLEPLRVAVDNSGGAHAEYVYAGSSYTNRVQQFDPAGAATAVTITEAAIPSDGTAQAGGLPAVVNNGTFTPRNVAVDGSGNVFVTDSSVPAIDVFDGEGAFVRQIAAGVVATTPRGIAVAGGVVYVAQSGPGGALGAGLHGLDAATGECIPAACTPIDPSRAYGVAVDSTKGIIYTTGRLGAEDGTEGKFSEYEASTGDLLGVTAPKELHSPEGIAVDESTGAVIVTDLRPLEEGTLKIFGPLEIVPDVTTLPPEEETDRSVTLKGEVGAAEVSTGATCTFQYTPDATYQADKWQGAAEASCEPEGPFFGTAMNDVEARVEGLKGGTTYHERILGTNENGSNPGEDIPFETKGPSVSGSEATKVGESEATLVASVDPNGSATTYRFQYLTRAAYEANPPSERWSGASEAPAGGESLGAGSEPQAVQARLEGLSPHTAYRFRALATSTGGESAGETFGEEVSFSTFAPPAVGLPDSRRYEQSSPPEKNGGNVQGGIDSVQASLKGDRVTFFSNTGIPGGEGAQEFPTFMASRSAGAWTTKGLLPPASYGPRASVLGWTEDLADTYDFAARPFQEGELLRRQSPAGPLTRAGTVASPNNPFAYAGSSREGAVALLESKAGGVKGLTGPADREGKQNVYAYDRATGELVVAGVMNDGSVPPGGAMAGPYDWFKDKSTTALGGALNNYYTQAGHAISADGSRIFFTAAGTGALYVRINPFGTPQELSAAQCREASNEAACTIQVSAPVGVADPGTPAAFLGASEDGRLVYFLDKGKLTADSTAGQGSDLYRYDVQTGSLTDLSVDTADRAGARVEGMLAIGGPQGEDAYFVASGALTGDATQAPVGETNLYALHGTTLGYVSRLGTGEREALDWIPTSEEVSGSAVTHASRLTADGRTLLLTSSRDLTPYRAHGKSSLPAAGRLRDQLHLLQPDGRGAERVGGGGADPEGRLPPRPHLRDPDPQPLRRRPPGLLRLPRPPGRRRPQHGQRRL